jgi:hypothetical protein
MAHLPINHHLQPLYRTLAGLIGAYIVAFGIAGVIKTGGTALFEQHNLPWVLGLHANRAFAILSIVMGAVLLIGAIIGGNVDQRINMVAAIVFLVAGLTMLVLQQTDLNFLGFSVSTCIVSFVFGLTLLLAGLYGKVGTAEDIRREEAFRHGQGANPDTSHPLTAPNSPHGEEKVA